MKFKQILLVILVVGGCFVSCDNNNTSTTSIVLNDRTEQQEIDDDTLQAYLNTHYYNASDFVSNPDPSLNDLIITKLPEGEDLPDPGNNVLLIDDVEVHENVNYEGALYTYYILKLNEGGGAEATNSTDTVLVNYEGFLTDESVFDSTVNPINLDLTTLIKGWGLVFSGFKEATGFIDNGDGTIDYQNHGVGVMFLPSGLAYFSSAQIGIPSYSPVIFKFELFQASSNDHDGDGIDSHLEDVGEDETKAGNGIVSDDDTDGDNLPDYLDPDDDGDGVLTKYEDLEVDFNNDGIITINDIGDGDPTNDFTGDDESLPNYLDINEAISNQVDENENGIPDGLEEED